MYSEKLPQEIESEIEKILKFQKFGGMILTSGIFNNLIPFVDYESKSWAVIRKQVDHLDQLTCSRKRK